MKLVSKYVPDHENVRFKAFKINWITPTPAQKSFDGNYNENFHRFNAISEFSIVKRSRQPYMLITIARTTIVHRYVC